nr:unnamed protein product [Digitaria exilis]
MSGAEEAAAGSGGGSSGAGSSSGGGSGGAKRRFDDKNVVARTSLILWHTHQNDVGAVRKLLEEDATLVNARDYDSRTPLHVAALHGWQDVAECLIANGADVNAQDRWQNTPLADAEGAKRQTMIELLKEHGGLTYGKTGSHFEPKTIPPPLTNKADWEINPLELDFTKAVVIGKGDLHQYLKEKGALAPLVAINFALDIASLVEVCWSGDISLRPSFLEILKRLEKLKEQFTQDTHWHLFQ